MNEIRKVRSPNVRDAGARAAGFTLVELLAVMVIISILLAIATPGLNGVVEGARLRGEGAQIAAEMARAQQMAVTSSRAIEVRFFHYPDQEEPGSDPAWRAVQFFHAAGGQEGEPIGDLMKLNSSVVFSDKAEFSSLFSLPRRGSALPGVTDAVTAAGFSFLPSGATNLPPVSDSPGGNGWHVSLIGIRDELSGGPASDVTNFITLQVDPQNGAVRSYQP